MAKPRKIIESQEQRARRQGQQQQKRVVAAIYDEERADEIRDAVEQTDGVEEAMFERVRARVSRHRRDEPVQLLWHPCVVSESHLFELPLQSKKVAVLYLYAESVYR